MVLTVRKKGRKIKLQQLGGGGTSKLTQTSCLGLKPHQCPCPGLSSYLLLMSVYLWLVL